MKRLEGENWSAEGSPAESKITNIVSGETESKEWTEEQDMEAMENTKTIEDTLDEFQDKYRQHDDVTRALESASVIKIPADRLNASIDNLLELSKRLHEKGGNESKRTHISIIVNKLRELL